jgi:biotin transport system substrate-specific component
MRQNQVRQTTTGRFDIRLKGETMAKSTYVPSNTVGLEGRTGEQLRMAGKVIAASLLVALCAHISIPLFFTPVPLTLQPFAVILIGLLLSPSTAFLAMSLYLLEGATGLPVFTPQGPGGILQLLGPTGGYLMSYPFAAAATSWLVRRTEKNFRYATLAAAAGNILILSCGALWLLTLKHMPFSILATQTILPFLPGDALKVVSAAGIATGLRRIPKKA